MTKIYGCSDDLIEFEGDIYGEIGAYNLTKDEPAIVKISDGTELKVYYEKDNKAIWGIEVIKKGTHFDRIEMCDNEDAKPYSDVVYLKEGNLTAKENTSGRWKKVS